MIYIIPVIQPREVLHNRLQILQRCPWGSTLSSQLHKDSFFQRIRPLNIKEQTFKMNMVRNTYLAVDVLLGRIFCAFFVPPLPVAATLATVVLDGTMSHETEDGIGGA